MKLAYKLLIESPSTHIVRVTITGKKESSEKSLDFFMPRWSPGSYLMREYARHISGMKAETETGERLNVEQTDISTFKIDWNSSDF